ncbi:MFS transporter [Streptomyces sp. NPDC059605]|uniref:MFS transporter n=1 Tax=unclassified Streptomyces TaxID=2593676 RepID=UPI003678D4A1
MTHTAETTETTKPATATTGDPTAPDPSRRKWIALAVVLLAAFLDNVDSTIVTVALPSIQEDLGADYATAQWTLAGYALAFAVFLITGGRLGDIFGRKKLFITGVVGFTLASVVCGVAATPGVLVGGRLAQGIMAALMVPQVMSVIMTTFDQKEWVVAFSMMGAVLGLGGVSGPLLGGVLTDLDVMGLGWRAVFLINIPFGVIAVALALWCLPESKSEQASRLDVPGVALITVAALGLMFPLVQGREQGWPAWMFVMMGAALLLLVPFALYQRRRHEKDGSALIPPTLFKHRSFTAGVFVVMLAFSGITSFFLVLTYQMQLGLGWSAIRTALVTVAFPIGITATFQIAWRKGTANGRAFVALGTSIMAIGTLLMILLTHTQGQDLTWYQVAGAELVVGLGMGLCSPILTNVVLGDVPPQDAGAGSGVVNALIQFGTATGIAVVGVIFFSLSGSGGGSRAERFSDATAVTLWYNVGVFALVALLSPLLPGRKTEAAEKSGAEAGADAPVGAAADRLVPDPA